MIIVTWLRFAVRDADMWDMIVRRWSEWKAAGLIPFAGAALVAWMAVPVGTAIDWRQYVASWLLLAVAGALAVARAQGRHTTGFGIVPNSFVFLLAVALLRNSGGGISSSAGGLSLIPVFYTALYSRSRRQLWLVMAGVAVFYLTPILIVGSPQYPDSQYRGALLSVLVSAIIGLTTQRLVADARHQAGEARSRGQMLEQVSEVVRGLLYSSDVRSDVCEAARTIGGASVAVLYEPVPGTGGLRSSAMAGLDLPPIDVPADRASALNDAMISGRPYLLSAPDEDRLASPETWAASGRPQSLLYQPLLRGSTPLGVLVVGWTGAIEVGGPRTTVVALLAHEAATVIDRTDAINILAGQAQTDALTGLPNRRTWDEQIRTAVAEQREFTIAMLDFDHFKEFNDTYGHPAGDRLLKETGAAWRDQMRAGDLLARLGGEEFGLLLHTADGQTASTVIERLRACVPHERTCSAGIAIRRAQEPAESAIARADRALYEAKRAGRDRASVSA